ncbi:SLC13 family permease [Pseudokineococcus marinus]|uniref:SLC13 family permease n=1 Tax=Pseudokineococcus marinus TaxID=351215 RepID=UPI002ADDC035|nr:SLC13 family permease [Pseudokineococcus marinus]
MRTALPRPSARGGVWLLLAGAGALAVVSGALSEDGARDVVGRTAPVLLFVLGITVVATLADRAGVFAAAAARLAVLAGGRRWVLWLSVVALATACTAVLSLDTTAVLLTPVVLVLARRTGTPPMLLAMTTVWLASTASLLLPVANLTNLLAVAGPGLPGGEGQFLRLALAPAVVGVLVTVAVLALLGRPALRGRYDPALVPPPVTADRGDLVLASVVCVLLAPALALLPLVGVPVEVPALVAAAALLAAAVRRRASLRGLTDLPLLVGVLGLFLLVAAAGEHGLTAPLASAAGDGEGFAGLLRLAAVGAVGANLVDNLPAYLALEPVAGSPERVVALLVGVGLGPLVTPWACLATLLWARACREAGVPVDWWRFAARGLVLVPLVVVAAVAALAVRPA